MTFRELIEAVNRDVAAINPKAYCTVGCQATRYALHGGVEVEVVFGIYHDGHLRHGLEGTWYHGATPDEAYHKFLAAVIQPAKPAYSEALDLCDTPTMAGEAVSA